MLQVPFPVNKQCTVFAQEAERLHAALTLWFHSLSPRGVEDQPLGDMKLDWVLGQDEYLETHMKDEYIINT